VVFVHAWHTCHSQTWNFVSWAISAEMGMYLALPLLFWITGRGRIVTALVTVASFVILLLNPDGEMPFHQWTWNFGVLRAVPGFLLGMLAFQLRDVLGGCRSQGSGCGACWRCSWSPRPCGSTAPCCC
jgi:peptidoglycan/LPS O-acetylase OafA/YrhL